MAQMNPATWTDASTLMNTPQGLTVANTGNPAVNLWGGAPRVFTIVHPVSKQPLIITSNGPGKHLVSHPRNTEGPRTFHKMVPTDGVQFILTEGPMQTADGLVNSAYLMAADQHGVPLTQSIGPLIELPAEEAEALLQGSKYQTIASIHDDPQEIHQYTRQAAMVQIKQKNVGVQKQALEYFLENGNPEDLEIVVSQLNHPHHKIFKTAFAGLVSWIENPDISVTAADLLPFFVPTQERQAVLLLDILAQHGTREAAVIAAENLTTPKLEQKALKLLSSSDLPEHPHLSAIVSHIGDYVIASLGSHESAPLSGIALLGRTQSPDALDQLIRVIETSSNVEAVCAALGEVATLGFPKVLETLQKAAGYSNPQVAGLALSLARKQTPQKASEIAAVAINHGTPQIVTQALEIIKEHRQPRTQAKLLMALQTHWDNGELATSILDTIDSIGNLSAPNTKGLLMIIKGKGTSPIRNQAILLLGNATNAKDQVSAFLASELQRPDLENTDELAIIQALGTLGRQEGVQSLTEVAKAKGSPLKDAAIAALESILTPRIARMVLDS